MPFMKEAIEWARRNAYLDPRERSDEEIINYDLVEALDTLSNLAPMRKAFQIQLVKDQIFYDLPDPSIRSVWYSENHRFEFSDEFPLYQWWRRSSSTSTLYGPAGYYSTPQIAYAAAEMYSAGTFEWNVEVRGNQLMVMPSPDGNGALNFIGRCNWDLRTEEGLGNGDGIKTEFDLSTRSAWWIEVTVNDVVAYDEDWQIVQGGLGANAKLVFDAPVPDTLPVVVKYLEHTSLDLVPQRLRRCLRLLLAAQTSRAVGLRRSRIPKTQIGPHKMELGYKAMLDHAKDLERKARSDGGIVADEFQIY